MICSGHLAVWWQPRGCQPESRHFNDWCAKERRLKPAYGGHHMLVPRSSCWGKPDSYKRGWRRP